MNTTAATVYNPYFTTTESLQRTFNGMQQVHDKLAAKADTAAAKAAECYAHVPALTRAAAQSLLDGLNHMKDAGKTAAYAASCAGAAAGFALASKVIGTLEQVTKPLVSRFAKGLLSLSNALAKAAGQAHAEVTTPAPATEKPSFAQRMWAKAKDKLEEAKKNVTLARSQARETARQAVVASSTSLSMAALFGARGAGYTVLANVYRLSAAAVTPAQSTVNAAHSAVSEARRSAARNGLSR
jgi:hypothetical protein